MSPVFVICCSFLLNPDGDKLVFFICKVVYVYESSKLTTHLIPIWVGCENNRIERRDEEEFHFSNLFTAVRNDKENHLSKYLFRLFAMLDKKKQGKRLTNKSRNETQMVLLWNIYACKIKGKGSEKKQRKK